MRRCPIHRHPAGEMEHLRTKRPPLPPNFVLDGRSKTRVQPPLSAPGRMNSLGRWEDRAPPPPPEAASPSLDDSGIIDGSSSSVVAKFIVERSSSSARRVALGSLWEDDDTNDECDVQQPPVSFEGRKKDSQLESGSPILLPDSSEEPKAICPHAAVASAQRQLMLNEDVPSQSLGSAAGDSTGALKQSLASLVSAGDAHFDPAANGRRASEATPHGVPILWEDEEEEEEVWPIEKRLQISICSLSEVGFCTDHGRQAFGVRQKYASSASEQARAVPPQSCPAAMESRTSSKVSTSTLISL